MSKFVYMLSTYEEEGAEDVIATLYRDKVLGLIRQNWPLEFPDRIYKARDGKGVMLPPDEEDKKRIEKRTLKWWEEAEIRLAEYLKRSDSELVTGYGHNCHNGWGGIQFHVVELV